MRVQVLDARVDALAWHALLDRLPESGQDIYFTPEWISLHSTSPASLPRLFVFSDDERIWAYPFLLRCLRQIGRQVLPSPTQDIESAYGYGGPVAHLADHAFLSEAWAAFADWSRSERIVAEFVRLHPLLVNESLFPREVECHDDRQTISVDLGDVALGREPYGADVRYMIRRAEREGVEIAQLSAGEAMPGFRRLYRETMERLSADEYYLFDDTYFERLAALVERSGWLLGAVCDGKCVAAAVFLRGRCWMHYHLAAVDSGHRVPGVMNLLLRRAAQLGAEAGLTRMHLGGGASRDAGDSLLRFKRTMGTGRHIFRIGKRIHDRGRYKELKSLWKREHPQIAGSQADRLLCYYDI